MSMLGEKKSIELARVQYEEIRSKLEDAGIFKMTDRSKFSEMVESVVGEIRPVDTGDDDIMIDFDYKNLGCVIRWWSCSKNPSLSGSVDFYDGDENNWYEGEGIYQFDLER